MRGILWLLLLASSAGFTGPAQSQGENSDVITLPEPDEEEVADEPRRRSTQLEVIIVTATKAPQSLRDVPAAITAVDGKTLRDAGIFGAEGIEDYVPNVELDIDAQAPTIGIRGFSTDSYNVGLEPSVGIVVDEIPLGRSEFIPDGLFDIERVEVLRGAQGTLFGKNTIAGVLIFGTGEPEYNFTGNALLTLGQNSERRIEAAGTIGLGDYAAGRLALVDWEDGGEIDNTFLQRRELANQQTAARLKFTVDALDNLTLKFGGQFSQMNTSYSGWQLYDADPDALDYAQSKDPETEDSPFNHQTSFDLPGFVKRDTHLIHALADWGLSEDLSLKLIAGNASLVNNVLIDFDVSAADLVRVPALFNYDQNSLELRVNGNAQTFGVPVRFVGGLFGFDSTMDISVDVGLGDDIIEFGATPAGQEALGAPQGVPGGGALALLPLPGGPIFDDGVAQYFEQQSRAYAIFGEGTWSLSESISVILGLRYGSETKDASLTVQSRGPGITAAILDAEDFSSPLARRESEVAPKLGLQYDFGEHLISYLSWTRGFKSGGFNAISFNSENLEFEPERGDNYELGIKSRLAGGSFALNANVYRTDVSNMQVVNFNGINFDVFNAAQAQLEGFEADLRWLSPWDWFSLNAAFAISRARYKSYPNAPAPADGGDENGLQDLSGKTLPKAPESTLSLSPTVSLPLPWGLGVSMSLDISHRGDQFLELDLDEHSFQQAYTLLNARISLGPEYGGSWGLVLRAENLRDEDALAFVADHNLYANSYFAAQIPERRVSLTAAYNW